MLVDFEWIKVPVSVKLTGKDDDGNDEVAKRVDKKLLVSYINKEGLLRYKTYDYERTKLLIGTQNDIGVLEDYKTWDGKNIVEVPVTNINRTSVFYFLDSLPDEEREEIFGFIDKPKIFYMDIETEIVDGFPEAKDANSRVLANSIVCDNNGWMMGLKDLSPEAVKRIENNVNEYFKKFNVNYKLKYHKFQSEEQMLKTMFEVYFPTMPIITGWNVIKYDWVYLVNRCRKLWPEQDNDYKEKRYRLESRSSITGMMIDEFDTKTKSNNGVSLPAHRLIVDYLDLFAKYDQKIKIKETNKLDFVGEQILGLKKIQYDGGLQELYESDFEKYMYYNIVDVILVKHIHEQCKYLDIMFAISSMAKIKAGDVFSAVRTTEGVLRDAFKKELNILFVKNSAGDAVTELYRNELRKATYKRDTEDILKLSNVSNIRELKELSLEELKEKILAEKLEDVVVDNTEQDIKGGWVKHPVTGMVQWAVVFDFASLYPTTMRQFNISPESYKGIKSDTDSTKCIFDGVERDIEPDDIVLLNGTVFKNENSTSKKIIERIFKDRKYYKNKMFEARAERIMLEKQLEKMI